MRLYILCCVGIGKNDLAGKPVAATFGCFTSMSDARMEMERIKTAPNHFADSAEWFISIDQISGVSK